MRIVSIAVSNLRSFKYDPTYKTSIDFDTNGLNLIIGPNGAGKSNLMEIIARLFSNVYNVDYSNNDYDLKRLVDINQKPQPITTVIYAPSTYTKNRDFQDKPSSLKLVVQLEATDINNLELIKKNKDVLKRVDDKFYSEAEINGYKSIYEALDEIPMSPTQYTIELSDINHSGPGTRTFEEIGTPNIASKYLRAYQMLINAIHLYNDYLKPEQFKNILQTDPSHTNLEMVLTQLGIDLKVNKPIENLLPLLQILSVQERLSEINLSYSSTEGNQTNQSLEARLRQMDRQTNQKSLLGGITSNQSETFEKFKELILQEAFRQVSDKNSVDDVVKNINKSNELLSTLNLQLDWFGLKIKLSEFVPRRAFIRFNFTESSRQAEIVDLSSGQRAILNIATALALTTVTHSVVVIDEIENHLHPSVQVKLREMLISIASKTSEVIAITHSSLFVNTSTLKNTARVFHIDGYSTIKMCGNALTTRKQKQLTAILDYTNGSRIFFTNNVLVVEGESDELLFNAYIKKFFPITDIEVLRVGGDAGVLWKPIIQEFGVNVYLIHDLDEVLKHFNPRPALTKTLPRNMSLDKSYLTATDYAEALKIRKRLRRRKEFILREGAIEEYINSTIPKIDKRKVDRMLDFLNNDDWSKLSNKREIDLIIAAILK